MFSQLTEYNLHNISVGKDLPNPGIIVPPGIGHGVMRAAEFGIYSEHILRWCSESDWVFTTQSGRPMDIHNVCRDVQRVFQKAGIYKKGASTIHLIRHSVASSLLSDGVDLECVREILGHADLKTTALYLHTTEERKKEASLKLGRLFG